jgi:peptidoglycan/xylan/chitin deacetylase (PgdA/CDA1 family)
VTARGTRRARTSLLRALGPALAFYLERGARLSGRRVGIALVYHRVDDRRGSLDHELVPALASRLFEAHVRHLTARYRIVPASDLVTATRERRRGDRFPVAITFDDDLPSHIHAAALLERQGATATFFVCGSSLHAPHEFWWERLQTAVDRGLDLSGLPGAPPKGGKVDVHGLGRAIEDLPPRARDDVDAKLRRLVGPERATAGLRADDVRRLVASGFEIGFHTRRHDRLPALDTDALERAMHEGRVELETLAGRRLTAIAYPHGRADARVAAAARAAGFEVGFTGRPEPVTLDADPLLLGRLSPSYDSVGELAFDLAWALLRSPPSR